MLFLKKNLLLVDALTHKSSNKKKNNEKLEFLGDRVIGLVLANKLFELYPNETEGVLDKKFASLVRKKSCAEIGWKLGIQNYIIIGNKKNKITQKDEKILCDCCEALVGSIYIDRGFKFVESFILNSWKEKLEQSNVTLLDPKTKLQEYSLKLYKNLPIYKFISSIGPRHNPIYKISVSINNTKEFVGMGSSKQLAQQDGANKLLKKKNIK